MKFTTIIVSLTLALTASAARRAPPKNYQEADGVLGGLAPAVTKGTGATPYQVAGGDAFADLSEALAQSCNLQDYKCSQWVAAKSPDPELEIVDCEDQNNDCVHWFDPDPKDLGDAY